MQYRYLKHTQDFRIGDVTEYDADSPRTRDLLVRGFIAPVMPAYAPAAVPPAELRETKPSRKKREHKNAASDE